MRTSKLLTLAIVAVLALSVVGPAAAAGGLTVNVTQNGEDVTVSVTQNNSSVAGAAVVVDAGNATYNESGNYTTSEEGIVELSAPEQNLTVSVTATSGNLSGSTTADLVAVNDTEANETQNETEANETQNETENATGRPDADLNVTSDNGTVDFSNVTIDQSSPFGYYVSSFVHLMQDTETSGPMGQVVSSFVTTFNHGHGPPAHVTRGPPEHAGPPENKTQGPPENKTHGPPEHAGPPENKTQGSSSDHGHGHGHSKDKTTSDDEHDDSSNGSHGKAKDR
ncbi:MAG: hypothetical protein ABEI57_08560 [Halapricum sp.]